MWRMDCFMDKTWPDCLSVPPSESKSKWPQCYGTLDGWDAMEGSISGGGCRPSNNAMMWAEAVAIATIATHAGNATLAGIYTERAGWLRAMYLELLWSDDVEFFSVYKLNPQGNANWACNCTENPTCDTASPDAGAAAPGVGGEPNNEPDHVRPEDDRVPLQQPADSQSPTCPHPCK